MIVEGVDLVVLRKVAMVSGVWPFKRSRAVQLIASVGRERVAAAADRVFQVSDAVFERARVPRVGPITPSVVAAHRALRAEVDLENADWLVVQVCLDACAAEFCDDWEEFVTVAGPSLVLYGIACSDLVRLSERIAAAAHKA